MDGGGGGSAEVRSSVASVYYRQMTPFVIRVGSSAPQQNKRTEQKERENSERTQSAFEDHRRTALAEQVLSGSCNRRLHRLFFVSDNMRSYFSSKTLYARTFLVLHRHNPT